MADKKITQLTATTALVDADLLTVVDDVAGTATNKKITRGDLFKSLTSVGIGTATPDTLLSLANDNWISAKSFAGTSFVNMLKVNASNEIDLGGSLNLDGSLEAATDAGAITLFNMPISSTPVAGTEMSATFKIGDANIFKIYTEADGAGVIQNPRLYSYGDIYLSAKNIVTDTTTGIKIGTATGQKLGFWNTTPAVQPTAVADASGGATVDTEGRAALNALLARLRTLGIIAT